MSLWASLSVWYGAGCVRYSMLLKIDGNPRCLFCQLNSAGDETRKTYRPHNTRAVEKSTSMESGMLSPPVNIWSPRNICIYWSPCWCNSQAKPTAIPLMLWPQLACCSHLISACRCFRRKPILQKISAETQRDDVIRRGSGSPRSQP